VNKYILQLKTLEKLRITYILLYCSNQRLGQCAQKNKIINTEKHTTHGQLIQYDINLRDFLGFRLYRVHIISFIMSRFQKRCQYNISLRISDMPFSGVVVHKISNAEY